MSVVAEIQRPAWLDEAAAHEWMAARGITVIEEFRFAWKVRIPSRCSHLSSEKPWKCDIYENRPKVCRDYDGRKSPDLQCAWKAEV